MDMETIRGDGGITLRIAGELDTADKAKVTSLLEQFLDFVVEVFLRPRFLEIKHGRNNAFQGTFLFGLVIWLRLRLFIGLLVVCA